MALILITMLGTPDLGKDEQGGPPLPELTVRTRNFGLMGKMCIRDRNMTTKPSDGSKAGKQKDNANADETTS